MPSVCLACLATLWHPGIHNTHKVLYTVRTEIQS